MSSDRCLNQYKKKNIMDLMTMNQCVGMGPITTHWLTLYLLIVIAPKIH
jgi:hypothetical protein